MSKISKAFESILPVLVEEGKKMIKLNEHYGDESALNIFFAAYNNMQDEEFNGDYYIFNLNDKDDLKYLVEHEILTACQIADLYPRCVASGLFRFEVDNYGNRADGVEIIGLEALKAILCNNMDALMRCVLMYTPENEKYQKVYNMIVSNELVIDEDFNQLR